MEQSPTMSSPSKSPSKRSKGMKITPEEREHIKTLFQKRTMTNDADKDASEHELHKFEENLIAKLDQLFEERDIEEDTVDNSHYIETNQRLEKENEDLKKTIKDMQVELDQSRKTEGEFRERCDELEKWLKEKSEQYESELENRKKTVDDLAMLTESNNELKRQISNLQSELESTKASLEDTKSQISKAIKDKESREEELQLSIKEITARKETAEESFAQLKEQNLSLQTMVDQLQKVYQDTQLQLSDSLQERVRIEQEAQAQSIQDSKTINLFEQNVHDLTCNAASMNNVIRQLEHQIEELETNLAESVESKKVQKQGFEAKIADIVMQKDAINKTLNQLIFEDATTKQKLDEAKIECVTIRQEKESADLAFNQLAEKFSALRTESDLLILQNEQIQVLLGKSEKVSAVLMEDISSLKKSLEEAHNENHDLDRERQFLNNHTFSLNEEIALLKDNISDEKKKTEEKQEHINELAEQIATLNVEMSASKHELERTKNNLATQQQTNSKLQEEVSNLQHVTESMEKEYTESKDRLLETIADSEELVDKLRRQLSGQKHETEVTAEERDTLKKNSHKFDHKLAKLVHQKEGLYEKIRLLERETRDSSKTTEELKVRNAELELEDTQNKNLIKSLEMRIQEEKDKNQSLQQERREFSHQYRELQYHLDTTKNQLKSVLTEKNELEIKARSLQKSYNSAEAQLVETRKTLNVFQEARESLDKKLESYQKEIKELRKSNLKMSGSPTGPSSNTKSSEGMKKSSSPSSTSGSQPSQVVDKKHKYHFDFNQHLKLQQLINEKMRVVADHSESSNSVVHLN